MLVLTREVTQEIRIGSDIRVAVLGIKGGYIRLGIEAPRNVIVDREEVSIQRHGKLPFKPKE